MERDPSPTPTQLHACTPDDRDELVALFQRCYEPLSTVFQPRTQEGWAWKYEANPRGSYSLATRVRGELAGHVGGVPFGFWCQGEERTTLQCTDHMVDPLRRGGLASGRLFRHLMRTWIETFCGPVENIIAWGFPSHANFRIGQRFMLYHHVGPVVLLVHDSIRRLGQTVTDLEATNGSTRDDEVDRLWRSCRTSLPMSHERDARFLRWRYGIHPSQGYRFLSVRDAEDRLRGVCVLRAGGLADGTLSLLEWIVEPEDGEAEQALLRSVAIEAERSGCPSAAVWLPVWHPGWSRLRRLGFEPQPAEALWHTASIFDPKISLEDVREGCAWHLGDIDYL